MMADTRSEGEQLLAYARQAAKWKDAGAKRRAALGLVRRLVVADPDQDGRVNLPRDRPTVGAILAEMYGSPEAPEYWSGWCDFGEPELLSNLLAAHLAAEALERGDADDLPESDAERLRVSFFLAFKERSQKLLAEFPGATLRERARAIAAHPERVHRLPEALRAFLASDGVRPVRLAATRAEAPVEAPKRKRGRKADVTPRVIAAMRTIDRARLAAMIEKEMEAEFGASRTTCRDARAAVLSGIVAN